MGALSAEAAAILLAPTARAIRIVNNTEGAVSDKAFREMDTSGKPHWSTAKIVESIASVLVTVALTTVINSQVVKYQIDQAQKKNDEQDQQFIRLAQQVVDLQKQMVENTTKLAAAQRDRDEQQRLIIEILKKR